MNAARTFLQRLGLFTQASTAIQEQGPEYWRERIFNYMLSTMLLCGFFAVVPSVWLSFSSGLIGLGVFDILAYVFVGALHYARRISYEIRASIFLLLGLTVGLVVFYVTGDEGAGLFWVFVVPPLASLLLGIRWGAIFFVVNVCIVIVTGYLVTLGAPGFPRIAEFSTEGWVVYSVNFLITNALVTLPLGALLSGLFHSTEEAQNRLARIRSLYAIDQAIIGSLDLDKTLAAVMRETRSQLGVDAVAIWLSNEQGWLDYSYGLGFEEVGHGQGKIKDQAGAIAPQSLDWLHMDKVFDTKFGAPLLAKDKMIGLLEVYEKSAIERSREWFETLLAIAGQSSIAIQNARLFEEATAARFSAERDADFFRLLFYNHPVPMWIYDLETLAFLEVNDAATENYGFTRAEFLNMTIKDIRPIEDVEKLIEHVAQERPDLQHSGGWRHRLKHGKVIDVEINSHTLEYKGHKAALVMAQDISERKQAQEKLRLSDDILQRVKSIVLVINADGKIIYVSPGAEDIIGYPPQELMGDGWWRLSRANSAEAETEIASLRMVAKGELQLSDEPYENSIQTRTGETRWIEWQDALGPNQTVIGVGRDVTERKNAEKEREQRIAELEAIRKISIALRSSNSLEEMLPDFLEAALEVMNATSGGLWLYDANLNELKVMATKGWKPGSQDKYGIERPGQGFAGSMFAGGKTEVVKNLRTDERIPAAVRADIDPAQTTVAVPIRSHNQLIGVFTADLFYPQEVNPSDVNLLTTLVEMAGTAIQRSLLNQKTNAQLEQMKGLAEIDRVILSSFDLRLNLQTLIKNVISQLGVDAANIMLYHPMLQTLESVVGSGFRTSAFVGREIRLGEGYAGKAALERRVVHIPWLADEEINPRLARALAGEDFVTYYAVPLIAKGEIRGVLEIFHRSRLQADEEWMGLLNTLASRAAVTIDTVKVFENLQKSNADLTLSYTAAIEGWSRALDLRDKETEGHSQRVTELALKLAQKMGLKSNELVHFRRGALLHDIGKMGIPDSILLKPGKLSDQEWEIMRQHPTFARDMLGPIKYLQKAADIPLSHHEKWDGSGYPQGLAGENIPFTARIFAVVDVYDALTSDRHYRKAWSKEKALAYIKEQSGKHFDPMVVEAFFNLNGE
jgi:PAS domain S-box-containing protein/putative nucleotidyltransferase with HDIG domain